MCKSFTEEEILKYKNIAEKMENEKRFKHSCNVADMAKKTCFNLWRK